MHLKTSNQLATILGCYLSACGLGVGQLSEAQLVFTTERTGGFCTVFAYIPPLDPQFATSGVQATINGSPAWVQQAVAAHESFFFLTKEPHWVHVPATAIDIHSQFSHVSEAAPFIDLEIYDDFSKIHVRAVNPCALDALDVVGPTRIASVGTDSRPAFRAGETVTLISDERGSWGTEPVPFNLSIVNHDSPVLARPDGNRLSFVMPDLGNTQPTSAFLTTTQRAIVPAFEKCEGLASCSYIGFAGAETVRFILEP